MAERPPVGGEVWALGSVLGYASGNVCDSLAVSAADPLLGPFLRGLPSLFLGLAMMWKRHTWAELQPGSARYVGRRAILPFLWAGFLSTIGLFLYYFAIRAGGLIVTVPLIETWVIWGTLAAWLMLGEELRGFLLLGWLVIALGLATLIFGQVRGQPLTESWYWAVPLAGFAAITYGVSGVLWREGQLRGADQSTAILLQFIASVGVGLAGLVALGKAGLLLSAPVGSLMSFLGGGIFSGVIAIYCIFKALRLAPVARVYAVSSLTPLTATVFARVFLHQYLNLPMLAGVLMICAGVVLTQVFRARATASAEAIPESRQEASTPR